MALPSGGTDSKAGDGDFIGTGLAGGNDWRGPGKRGYRYYTVEMHSVAASIFGFNFDMY